jgi:hypothetical protein
MSAVNNPDNRNAFKALTEIYSRINLLGNGLAPVDMLGMDRAKRAIHSLLALS